MKSKSQTIFIIDDDMSVCDALRWLFESIHLSVETFSNAALFLEHQNIKRGCIIIDVRLPGMSGLELLEQLKLRQNRLPVIMITGHGDIPMAVRAMKAGVSDFVLKPFNDQCLIEIVQKCINQSSYPESTKTINERIKCLSEREHEVIELIMAGNLNKEIAFALSVSISTIESHRANLMQKMQAKNIAQLIKMYLVAQFNHEHAG